MVPNTDTDAARQLEIFNQWPSQFEALYNSRTPEEKKELGKSLGSLNRLIAEVFEKTKQAESPRSPHKTLETNDRKPEFQVEHMGVMMSLFRRGSGTNCLPPP